MKLHEVTLQQWVEHASRITIKRLDDELRCIARSRHESPRAHAPLPLGDSDWHASLRLAPGEARLRLLSGGLAALAAGASANVFLRLNGPADVIRDLRHSLNQCRVQLAAQCQRLQHCTPAEEARLFPSIRLAQRYVTRDKPIPDWLCLLALLEEFAEEWDNPRHMPRRPTDTIASRDGWRCSAPGCTARQVEVHHIVYQSHGGSDNPANLTALCPFHHRMGEHGGLTKVTGTAPLGLHWQLGRSRVAFANERLVAGA